MITIRAESTWSGVGLNHYPTTIQLTETFELKRAPFTTNSESRHCVVRAPEVGLAVPTAVAAADVKPLAEVERDYIGAVLRAVHGNRTQAAAKLGIGPATLYRKLKQYSA